MRPPRLLLLAALLVSGVALGFGFAAQTKAAPKKSSKAPATAGKKKAKSSKKKTAAVRRPSAPDAARLREIQQALAGRGYETPVDGVWGKESTAALKKFQEDQKITPARGALTALTLIALGLGPNKESQP